jgi:hypothetical protein
MVRIERGELFKLAQSTDAVRVLVVMSASTEMGMVLGADLSDSQVGFEYIGLLAALFIGVGVYFACLLDRRASRNEMELKQAAGQSLPLQVAGRPNIPTRPVA